MSDVIQLLKSLVRIPSVSRREKPLADFLEAYIRAQGLPVERHGDNLITWLGSGPHTLLLASHLDTVPPPETSTYPPFEAVEVNGRIYGRGAVDAKGCVAAMLWSLITLHREAYAPPGGRVELALTVGEEIGGDYNGMANLRAQGRLRPQAALIGEPTGLAPCVAQKGLLIGRVITEGPAAHAARAPEETAITRAAEAVLALRALTFDREDPWVGLPRVTVTQIRADGGSRNVVPATCEAWVDVRSTPAYPHEVLIDLLRETVAPYGTFQVHSQRLVPVATPVEHPLVQACLAAAPDQPPMGSPTLSDWVFLADVPAVKIGPGHSEQSHTPDEYIEVAQLLEGVRRYTAIIRRYFAHLNAA